jgi:hypothetical protein
VSFQNNYTKNSFFKCETPLELLIAFDEEIREGRVKLTDWQVKKLKAFGRDRKSPDEKVLEVLRAANGSGKSALVLAPCITWIPYSFDYGLSYVTSASAYQLDTQTERYIDYLISNINKTFRGQLGGTEYFKAVKRQKTCIPTGGKIDLIATDEAGRAEGKHPLNYNSEFAIFVDEGKSIDPLIYTALDRCTGYTRRFDASSPGDQLGHFYDICTRKELGWNETHITAFDCPWISKQEIEQAILKYGLHDPFVRSAFFAEFTSVGNKTIVTIDTLNQLDQLLEEHIRIGTMDKLRIPIGQHDGLDLSAGGDEVVLSMWDDNFQVAQETCRFTNTLNTVKEVIHWFQKYKRNPIKCWADDGGIGRGIIDNLWDKGYKVNRVLNQHRAYDKTRYANRGIELAWNFKRFLEEGQIFPLKDPLLRSQTCNRYYKTREISNQLILESKEQAKANGHPSPDRFDAAVLAWADFQYPIHNDKLTNKPPPSDFDGDPVVVDLEHHFQLERRKQLGVGFDFSAKNESSISKSHIITQDAVVENMLKYSRYLRSSRRPIDTSLVKNNKDVL